MMGRENPSQPTSALASVLSIIAAVRKVVIANAERKMVRASFWLLIFTRRQKKPLRLAGTPFSIWGGYILGLHFFALASQTPPALVHAGFVFAEDKSCAKVGPAKVTASPTATIAATNLFMT